MDGKPEIMTYKSMYPVNAATGVATQDSLLGNSVLEHPQWGSGIALSVLTMTAANEKGVPTLKKSYFDTSHLYTLPQKKRNFNLPIFHSSPWVPTLI